MPDDPAQIEHRVQRTLDRLRSAIHPERTPLAVGRGPVTADPIPVAEALGGDYVPAAVGDRWGPPWSTTWFRLSGSVPAAWAGRPVEALVDLGFDPGRTGFQCEGLVYRPDGSPMKGLHPQSQWVRVSRAAAAGQPVDLFVEAAANPVIPLDGPTPLGDRSTAGRDPLYVLAGADLAVFDPTVWDLVHDLQVLAQLAAELPASAAARRRQILLALDAALDRVDLRDVVGSAAGAREPLRAALSVPAPARGHRVSAVGHAHIDSAWLWPTRETVRKVARTAANVVDLLSDHPELVYAMSSAQQFAWLEQHRPEVFARVAERVQAGGFVPVGGMWVESDTNLPGGEALARQFAHGKRYFLDRFGLETEEVWLPDSFGFTAALPQLIALSGSRWFLTQKISWNETNRFPHHTFWWEGIDGTRVFTHFPPVDTYNSDLSGRDLAHAARNVADEPAAARSLVPFGFGDGGGGPTREMLARAARLRDLAGSPQVTLERPAEFFARVEAEFPDAPVWSGELYLEFHRGTYTSQAAMKRGNRRSEHLLREAELWCATAAVRTGAAYPSEALDRLWRLVLLQQFHDILPGSSIAWVHREARANYAAVAAELESLIGRAIAALAGAGDRELAFNAAPHPVGGVPALGAGPAAPVAGTTSVRRDGGGYVLDNGLLRVRIDARGVIGSVLDLRADREVVPPGGAANLLQLHRDTPRSFDAWNVDASYRAAVTDLVDVDELAAAPGGVRVAHRFGRSTVVQEITLPPAQHRLDVETEVDWHERQKFLKAGVDLDVVADRSAAEIQFGHVRRPTHTNTSWDAARFEICAHRWLHVGEPAYGVAVVNDCVYGHDVTRHPRDGGGVATRVRLSLLRAPRNPDPETDQGRHRFRYAVVPGATVADAVREGYRMNLPPRVVRGAGPVAPLVEVTPSGVVVESVKLADDRSGDVVVRLYEALGDRQRATIRPGFAATGVVAVDLLERPRAEPGVALAPGEVTAVLRPFQILTLRFRR
jgi:alpha-mannosidase